MASDSKTIEAASLLQRCAIFRDLDPADALVLAGQIRRRTFTVGDGIFRTGEPGDSLMAIVQGAVRISRPTSDGEEMVIADFGAGEVFGEIAVLDGLGRSADATALTNGELIVLERRDIVAFLNDRPAFCISLLGLLCAKLRLADERASDFLFLGLPERLAKALLAYSAPDHSDDRARKISLTQGDLGKIVGATRPKVNRQLKEWERGGLIELRSGWILVVDRVGLGVVAATT